MIADLASRARWWWYGTKDRLRRRSDRVLGSFVAWFCSGMGVWQTSAVTLGIVALECTKVLRDDHGFWLLYWLTVYSAVTQPALAYSGAVQGRRYEQLLVEVRQLDRRIEGLETVHGEQLDRILNKLERSPDAS